MSTEITTLPSTTVTETSLMVNNVQKLRESGALTDAEFEQQKHRILGSDAR
ncbi:MAG TPA: SHOCT domain-containing protein [Solirubrobacteraceae bacterium]|nr:SHOCT domain-containing protein [Solirubrobacteraceae bacterium]